MADLFPILGDVAEDLQVQAQRAAACGLVRVNDLPLWQFGDFDRKVEYVVEPLAKDLGLYCANNSRIIVVTREGDAWWGSTQTSKWIHGLRKEFFSDYGLEGGFVSVPASNGEQFLPDHLLARMADPFVEPPRGRTRAF